MSRRNLFRLAFLVSLLVTSAAAANSQTVVYDWKDGGDTPEQYPQIVHTETVTFRIRNVNDILFSYKLRITQTPITGPDFNTLAGLGGFPAGAPLTGAVKGCAALELTAKNLTNAALDKLNGEPKLPPGYAKLSKHESVPLEDSIAAWNKLLPAINEAENAIGDYQQAGCSINPDFKAFERAVEGVKDKINLPHVFEQSQVIEAGNNVSVDVIESYQGVVTKTKTFTFPGVNVLTLSAGALFSRIPERTYEARKSPVSDLNLLTVEGNSRATPSLVGLLNYSLGSIGSLPLDSNKVGLALSAGPVIKLGNQSEASSFGFFAGGSVHFYHRFYITPGIHFGQFADFPVGFGNGSTVPANFGELTPVKRWTSRFALAITFKAADFSGLKGSDKPKVTGTEAGKKPNATSSTDTSPSSDFRASSMDRSDVPLSVQANFLRPPAQQPATEIRSELNEPKPQAVVRTEPSQPFAPAAVSDSRRFVSATPAASMTHLSSITSAVSADGERVALMAAIPIREYRVYFRSGRFFLSLPHTRLDVFQDGLAGQSFTDAVFEQHGDECVISFALSPGTKARVDELSNGLAVVFFAAGTN